jgi:hypothetical protein
LFFWVVRWGSIRVNQQFWLNLQINDALARSRPKRRVERVVAAAEATGLSNNAS